MPYALKLSLAAAFAATLCATPALADEKYYLPYTYAMVGESNDGDQRVYLQEPETYTANDRGWVTAILVRIDQGADVDKSTYGEAAANWIDLYYNCADKTYGLHGTVVFEHRGWQRDMHYVWPEQVEFRPVPDQSYLTAAYQAACGIAKPSGYAQVGPIVLEDLINADIARWKKAHGVQ